MGLTTSRVVRPNLNYINQLRKQRNLPALHVCDRSEAVRNVLLADDEPGFIKLYKGNIGCRLAAISGRQPNIVSISSPNNMTEGPNIHIAVTMEETAMIADYTLKSGAQIGMVVTDFNMKGITGETITRQLRDGGFNGYIIGLTSQPDLQSEEPSNIELFYRAGADLALDKLSGIGLLGNLFTDRITSWLSKKAEQYARWFYAPGQSVRLSLPNSYRPEGLKSSLKTVRTIENMLSDPAFIPHYKREEIDGIFVNEILAKDGNLTENYDVLLSDIQTWAHIINNKISPVITSVQLIEKCLESGIAPQLAQKEIDEILSEFSQDFRNLKIIEDWIYHNASFMQKVIADWRAQNPDMSQ